MRPLFLTVLAICTLKNVQSQGACPAPSQLLTLTLEECPLALIAADSIPSCATIIIDDLFDSFDDDDYDDDYNYNDYSDKPADEKLYYCVDQENECIVGTMSDECSTNDGDIVYRLNPYHCPARLEPALDCPLADTAEPECGITENLEAGDVCVVYNGADSAGDCDILLEFEPEFACDVTSSVNRARWFRVDAPPPRGSRCPSALTSLSDIFGCPLRNCNAGPSSSIVSGEYCEDDGQCGNDELNNCAFFDIYRIEGPYILEGHPDADYLMLAETTLPNEIHVWARTKTCQYNLPSYLFDASECNQNCEQYCDGRTNTRLCMALCLDEQCTDDEDNVGPCTPCEFGGFQGDEVAMGNIASFLVHAWQQYALSIGDGVDATIEGQASNTLVYVENAEQLSVERLEPQGASSSDGCKVFFGSNDEPWIFTLSSSHSESILSYCQAWVDQFLTVFLTAENAFLESDFCSPITDFQVKTLAPIASESPNDEILWYAKTAAFYVARASDTHSLESHIRIEHSARSLMEFAAAYFGGWLEEDGTITDLISLDEVNLSGNTECKGRGREVCLGCSAVESPLCWRFHRSRDAQQACLIAKALTEKGYLTATDDGTDATS